MITVYHMFRLGRKRVKDWGKDFIYIVSQADKAFNMICGAPDSVALDEDGQEIE